MVLHEMLLTKLAEECVETAHRATKALTFGAEEIQTGQDLTNGQRIVYEFNDIVAVMEVLYTMGVLPKVIDRQAIELKKEKLVKYLEFSVQCGTLQGPTSYTFDGNV